jgi:hypothetical protein
LFTHLTKDLLQGLVRQLVTAVSAQNVNVAKLTETLSAQMAVTSARPVGGRKRATTNHIDILQVKLRSRPAAPPLVWDRYSTPATKEYAEFEEALSPNMCTTKPDGTVVFPAGSINGPYLLWLYSPDKAPDEVKVAVLADVMEKLGRGSPVQVWARCVARCVFVTEASAHPYPPRVAGSGRIASATRSGGRRRAQLLPRLRPLRLHRRNLRPRRCFSAIRHAPPATPARRHRFAA